MKASFILVLVLVAFSCGGKKKKPSSGGGFDLKKLIRNMRTVAPTTMKTSPPKTNVKPTVKSSNLTVIVKNNFNLRDINTTEQFLQVLGLGNKGPQGGNGHGSADVVFGFICDLQPTFVEIPDPLKLVPCIKVNRCSGCCLHEYLACSPTSSKWVSLSYPRYTSSSSSSRMSMSVRAGSSITYEWAKTQIEEHLGCACGCRYGPSSCNKRQYWDESNCQCKCHNQYTSDAMRCEYNSLGHFKHDPNTCLCKCALKDVHCGLKKEWDVKECRCVCKEGPDVPQCKRNQIRDTGTCDCVYNK